MSDRRILVAKRRNERSFQTTNAGCSINSDSKRGSKRAVPPAGTPKKNIANDRLKRLRTCLNNDVKVQEQKKHVFQNQTRKVPQKRRQEIVDSQSTISKKEPRIANLIGLNANKSTQGSSTSTAFKFIQPTIPIEEMEWTFTDNEANRALRNSSFKYTTEDSGNDFYVVVDTNVLISNLQIVQEIVKMDVKGDDKPVIFIPWMVIEELDFFKEDPVRGSKKWKAQTAIKYIQSTLNISNSRMRGQSLEEVGQQKDTGKSQDNKIIGCCLQIQEKYKNMALLTNDINLRNKAIFNHIPVSSSQEIMNKIRVKFLKSSKIETIFEEMTSLCQTVIKECAVKAYGQACHKMPILQSNRNSLQDCVQIFKRYWFPVFEELLMKQFKSALDDLNTFLETHDVIRDDTQDFNNFLRLCVRFCLFLKDIDSCKHDIESCILFLNGIKHS